jgi:uncharacterized membrane protein
MSSAADFLTEEEKTRVVAAIAEAEQKTVGEIRIHIENWCWSDAYKHGKDVFLQLGMDKTEQHSGVLIYVAVKSHKAAIIGDSGINEKVPDGFWAVTLAQMLQRFRGNNAAAGLEETVRKCGEVLAEHFPRTEHNPDELSNEISFGA